MNRTHYGAIIALLITAYFLGFYQITPTYLMNAYKGQTGEAKTTTTPAKPTATQGRTVAPVPPRSNPAVAAEVQPTPWPAPEGWQR